MSTKQDIYYKQMIDYLTTARSDIRVSRNFHGQMAQIYSLLRNDSTALISTIMEYMIHSATVSIGFNTDNANLTKLFESWKKQVNKNIGIDIPRGLRSISEQYHRERLTSSFIVLNIKWGKQNGYILPSRMWFTEGASVYTKNDKGNLSTIEYNIGRNWSDKKNRIIKEKNDTNVIIRKPNTSLYKEYPVPYLARKGALQHALIKQVLLDKQSEVLNTALPYIMALRLGSKGAMPDEKDLKDLEKKFKEKRDESNDYNASKGLVGAFPGDTNIDHIIPMYSNIINKEIMNPIDKNILSAMGMIELVGFSNSREETILNPKILVEEVTDSVLDYVNLLEEVVELIKEKNNETHRKGMNNDIRVVPGTIKSFITNDMKILYRSLSDRGIISPQAMVEDTTGLNFEVQYNTIKENKRKGIDKVMTPPPIMYIGDEVDDPEKIKEETPEKKKTEKDIEKAGLEETEVIKEKLENVDQIPKEIKAELTMVQQKKFVKVFNKCFEICSEMDEKMREFQSLKFALKEVNKKKK